MVVVDRAAETFARPGEWRATRPRGDERREVFERASAAGSRFELFRRPRICHVPTQARRNQRLCLEVVDLAGEAGLTLDHWQEWVLQHWLLLTPAGLWAAIRAGLVVGRQNGKGGILEARELAALFLDPDDWPMVAAPVTIHTAHEAGTAGVGFNRLWSLIDDTPWLRRRVARDPNTAEGKQKIVLRDGRRIEFVTRTSGGRRGYSADLLVFDEAMRLDETIHEASYYATSARPNPQIIYTGSAPDQLKWDPKLGVVLAKLRRSAMAGDEDLVYFEYSLDYDRPEDVPEEVAMDPESWRATNPAMGIRISERTTAVEQRGTSARGFARERLSVGDWPTVDGSDTVIPREAWRRCACPQAEPDRSRPHVIAFDVSPSRTQASVGVAGWYGEQIVIALLANESGNPDWVIDYLAGVVRRSAGHRKPTIVYDLTSPAASLVPKLDNLRVWTRPMNGTENAVACGAFFDAATADPPAVLHRDEGAMNDAVKGAAKRDVGDRYAWARRKSSADITPLVCATLSHGFLLTSGSHTPQVVTAEDLLAEPDVAETIDDDDLPPL